MRRWSFLLALVIVLGLVQSGSMGGSLFRGTVAFHAKQGGSYYIRALAIPGGVPRGEEFSGGNPSLSPSGKLVAFERQGDIWIARLDGTVQRNLTNTPGYEGCPSFSADGRMIAFNAQLGEVSQVHLINTDGTGRRALALGPGNNA